MSQTLDTIIRQQTIAKGPKSFYIKADQIPVQGVVVSEALDPVYVSALLTEDNHESFRAVAKVQFEATLTPEASWIRLNAAGNFALAHSCVRCLNDVVFHLPLRLNLRLVAATAAAQKIDADLEMGLEVISEDDADLSCFSYENGTIDLGAIVREQLFLELPSYPACDGAWAEPKQACAFIPVETATVDDRPPAHPFAKLADMKLTWKN